jgi:hypothetical protein
MEGSSVRHHFKREPPNDHPSHKAMSSLTYLACFSLKVFFRPIYTDYAYFGKKIQLTISAQKI